MSEITQLPDGSAFFTSYVMSREEAMKLPVEKRPICYRISSEMYHAVFSAIGETMVLGREHHYMSIEGSELASKVAVNLCFKIAEELERKKP